MSEAGGTSRTKGKGSRFVAFFGPVLDALRELGASARPQEVYELVAKRLSISDAELDALNKNGRSKFENRVAWARFYLAKAGLIDPEQRGVWVLTELGRDTRLTHDDAYRLFREVQSRVAKEQATPRSTTIEPPDSEEEAEETSVPTDSGYANEDEIRERLVGILRGLSAKGFEELSALVLRQIGFENVVTIGGRSDRGVDGEGFLLLNRFVRTKVFFQSKRYQGKVGPEKIRDFRGAIQGRADRGIFLTTGAFTREAREEAARENATPIELVDIDRLITILIEEKLGLEERKALQLSEQFFNVFAEGKT